MVQLQYTSLLTLDGNFDQTSNVIDLIAAVDDALPTDSPIRSNRLFTTPPTTARSTTSTW